MNRQEIGIRYWAAGVIAGPLPTLSYPAALGTVGCGKEGRQRKLQGRKRFSYLSAETSVGLSACVLVIQGKAGANFQRGEGKEITLLKRKTSTPWVTSSLCTWASCKPLEVVGEGGCFGREALPSTGAFLVKLLAAQCSPGLGPTRLPRGLWFSVKPGACRDP